MASHTWKSIPDSSYKRVRTIKNCKVLRWLADKTILLVPWHLACRSTGLHATKYKGLLGNSFGSNSVFYGPCYPRLLHQGYNLELSTDLKSKVQPAEFSCDYLPTLPQDLKTQQSTPRYRDTIYDSFLVDNSTNNRKNSQAYLRWLDFTGSVNSIKRKLRLDLHWNFPNSQENNSTIDILW